MKDNKILHKLRLQHFSINILVSEKCMNRLRDNFFYLSFLITYFILGPIGLENIRKPDIKFPSK